MQIDVRMGGVGSYSSLTKKVIVLCRITYDADVTVEGLYYTSFFCFRKYFQLHHVMFLFRYTNVHFYIKIHSSFLGSLEE